MQWDPDALASKNYAGHDVCFQFPPRSQSITISVLILMNRILPSLLFTLAICASCLTLHAEDAPPPLPASPPYYVVTYEPSQAEGELKLGVTYALWVPPGVKELRGVIVHQHGCGEGACKGGATAAYDLHWQALAKKWDCALLGPSYHQHEKDNCQLWCDPRQGSDKIFLKALGEFATRTGHAELTRVPWCLWGHSGGATWAGTMLLLHPERIVAVWLRSGQPKFSVPPPAGYAEIPAAALEVPVMCNVGIQEKEGRFATVWIVTVPLFKEFRGKGGLIGYAPDPHTSHQCGDSRYLSIPYFDTCLAERLPEKSGAPGKLKPMDRSVAWLAPFLGDTAQPAASYTGDVKESVWLPNERVAKAWSEYVKTGDTNDTTPPPAPTHVRVADGAVITWDAEADFESGIGGFIIERDGNEIGHLPEKPDPRYGRPLFQRMSYHDTPEPPLPVMQYTDTATKPGEKHEYRVRAVNSAGLKSEAAGP